MDGDVDIRYRRNTEMFEFIRRREERMKERVVLF
jgi:hypothetical protein